MFGIPEASQELSGDPRAPLVGEPLAQELTSRLEQWKAAHEPQKQQHLQDYRDREGIDTGNTHVGTGLPGTKKARKKVMIKSTRNKWRAASAKLVDALFGQGRWPFDTEPNDADLRDLSDVVEELVTWRLEQSKYDQVVEQVVESIVCYGTGFLAGPFVRERSHRYVHIEREPVLVPTVDEATGQAVMAPKMREDGTPELRVVRREPREHKYKEQYFEHADTMDVYPDPFGKDTQDGRGVYWVTRKTREDVMAWRKDPSYKNIEQVLTSVQNGTLELDGSEEARNEKASVNRITEDGRIVVIHFYGKVREDYLKAWEAGKAVSPADFAPGSEALDVDRVEAVVVIAGGVVVKAGKNPDPWRPIWRGVYERDEKIVWGTGVAKNNHGHQAVQNACLRVYLESKALALNPPRSVDRSVFRAGENFMFFPGKVLETKPNLTPEQRKNAIILHDIKDVSDGWERPIMLWGQFQDDDTNIPKHSQGENAAHLNQTASGAHMLLSNAQMPLKKVIRNIDTQIISPSIDALRKLDLEILDFETVKIIFGEKKAAAWQAIKDFGASSWMSFKTTGTSSFISKEITSQKLAYFIGLVSSSPELMNQVDMRELGEQVWDTYEIGKESPFLSDADIQKREQARRAAQGQDPALIKLQADIDAKMRELDIKQQEVEVKAGELDVKQQKLLKDWEVAFAKIDASLAQARIAAQASRQGAAQ